MGAAAVCGPTEKGRAALAQCVGIVGSTGDAFAGHWRDMPEAERDFWLNASRLPRSFAHQSAWGKIPPDVRATLKANLYRAAKRADVLLRVPS